jgi:UDP-N-acetylmuramoyl-tripeptide--D-alanyl-D-alanine ligase
VQTGAAEVQLSRWRGEEVELPGGGLLINDAYNANPDAMSAALAHLAARASGRRKVAILGEMAELGADAAAFHVQVGAAAQRVGVDGLLAVGPLARNYLEGAEQVAERRWVPTVEEAIAALDDFLRPGDAVLVKASRAAGLEAVAEAITAVRV